LQNERFASVKFFKISFQSHRNDDLTKPFNRADDKGWLCRVVPFSDEVEKLICVNAKAVAAVVEAEIIYAILEWYVSVSGLACDDDRKINTQFFSVALGNFFGRTTRRLASVVVVTVSKMIFRSGRAWVELFCESQP